MSSRVRPARRDGVALAALLALVVAGAAAEPLAVALDDDVAVHARFLDVWGSRDGGPPIRTYASPGEQLDPWGRSLEQRLIPRTPPVPPDLDPRVTVWYVDPRRPAPEPHVVNGVDSAPRSLPLDATTSGVLYSRGPDGRDDQARLGSDDIPIRRDLGDRMVILGQAPPITRWLAGLLAAAWLAGRAASALDRRALRIVVVLAAAGAGAAVTYASWEERVGQLRSSLPPLETLLTTLRIPVPAAMVTTLVLLLALVGGAASARPPAGEARRA